VAGAGSIVGVVSPTAGKGTGSSAELLLAADTRAAAVVSVAAPGVSSTMRRTTLRRITYGAGAALTGGLLFLAGSPAGRGRAAAILASAAHVAGSARAGPPGRRSADGASRWQRHGDRHRPGRGARDVVDPRPRRAVEADGACPRSRRPSSSACRVRSNPISISAHRAADAAAPRSRSTSRCQAFLADLGLTARFPSYLGRADEPLLVGPDVIPLPGRQPPS